MARAIKSLNTVECKALRDMLYCHENDLERRKIKEIKDSIYLIDHPETTTIEHQE